DLFVAAWNEPLAEFVELQRLPELQGEPRLTERARPIHANPVQQHPRSGRPGCVGVKQGLLLRVPGYFARELLRVRASLGVQLTQVNDRLLDDLLAPTHGSDEPPVGVGLAGLAANAVS